MLLYAVHFCLYSHRAGVHHGPAQAVLLLCVGNEAGLSHEHRAPIARIDSWKEVWSGHEFV